MKYLMSSFVFKQQNIYIVLSGFKEYTLFNFCVNKQEVTISLQKSARRMDLNCGIAAQKVYFVYVIPI